MTLPHGPRSPRWPRDHRRTDLSSHGRIPTGPRADRQPVDSGIKFYDRWRPSPDRYHRRDDQGRRQERHYNTERRDRTDPFIRADPAELFVPEYRNPMQFLAEGFAHRQRELREEAERQEEEVRYPHNYQDPLEPQPNVVQPGNEPGIKKEPSEDSVPLEADSASSSSREHCEDAPPKSTKRCTCPIGWQCEAKENGLIDCRTLVSERDWWNWKNHFDENYQPALPRDVDPSEESYATFSEVRAIIRLLDEVPRRRRRSMILRTTYVRIREWIRKMQHNSVTEEALTRADILDHLKAFLADSNRPSLEAKDVPDEIIEDLTILYRKWDFGDFSVLPQRGLIRGGPIHRRPDPEWPFKRSCDYFGHGHLVNGQVWSLRAQMMRDGAHGPPMAGICGTIKQGAKSIVMGLHDEKNKDYYADIDDGETIWYFGTALDRDKNDTEATNIKDPDHGTYRAERVTPNAQGKGPTNATRALFESYRTGRPVRVFRSFRLAEIVKWRPSKGFRYDGLYIVKEPILDKKERQIYKFKMVRMKEGQGPLRHANAPLQPERTTRKRRRSEEV